MMDIISMLGYSNNSPFKGNPYLDIHTPNGLIDMSNTDMDLIGIDNKGNKKKMKAGRKNPYKFEGDIVREVPMQVGGLHFLEPNDKKLPKGIGPYLSNSSELAISIGGENGEPAYLIPSMKYGRPLDNPYLEFLRTGDHLGGPFKTWQEADEWEKNVRHPYVEKGESIPTPIRRWSLKKEGNPYQEGGITPEQVFNFLFEGDDQEEQRMQQEEAAANLAAREAEIKKKEKTYNEQLIDLARQRRQVEDDADYNEAMAIAYGMFGDEELPTIGTSNNSGKAIPTMNRPLGPSAGKGVNLSVLRTEKDIFSEFEGITNLGIWGDKSHQQRVSDHNTGDAQDFGIGTDIDKGNKIAQKLIAEAGDRKVKYIIFNGKIWNPSISNEWRPYRGKNPHSTHVHVSYHR